MKSLVPVAPVNLWTRLPVFWRFQLMGWLTFEVLSFPLKVIILGTFEAAGIAAVLRDGAAFLLTLAMRAIYLKAYEGQATQARIAAVLLPVCIGAGLLLTIVSLALERVTVLEHEALFGPMAVFRLFYFCTSIFIGWSFLYFGIKLMCEISERNVRLARAETGRKNAELKMLRAQMAPHFLFNALNAIRAGIDQRSCELIALVEALSGYLRYSLAHRNDNFIPAQEEFAALADYLTVEKARFRDNLELEWQIDDAVRSLEIPSVFIQPLVENAIKYGRKTSPMPLRVQIGARIGNGLLELTVANTGSWEESAHSEPSHGLALQNLQDRLAILYPGRQTFEATAKDGWVRVILRIPLEKKL